MQHRSDGLFRGDLLHIGDRRVSVGTFALIKTTFDRKVPDIPYPASGSGAAGSLQRNYIREKKNPKITLGLRSAPMSVFVRARGTTLSYLSVYRRLQLLFLELSLYYT